MYESTSIFVVAETVIFVCSGVLASLSYRAYQRRQSRSLGALFGGLTLVTLGALLGGVLIALSIGTTVHAASASAAIVAAGFVIVTYSMYVDGPSSLSA